MRVKRTRKHNNNKSRKHNNKSRKIKMQKYNIIMTNLGRGPYDENTTNCCMCGKPVDKDRALMPSECSIKHGRRAHRICEECWFRPETGFAVEGRSHKCPGCEKGLPLTFVKPKTPEMVDLTMDSD